MDYLIVTIAALLFPYVFNTSGVDYQARFGVNTSFQEFNHYNLKLIEKKGEYVLSNVTLINYTGYGLRPDLFLEYGVSKRRLWIAPTFGFDPLVNGIQYKSELGGGGSSSKSILMYNKGPYVALKLGFSLLAPHPEGSYYDAFGVTPYITGGVIPVSYESESYYNGSQEKRYIAFWGAGAKVDFLGPWSFNLQYKAFSFDTSGSNLPRQVNVCEHMFQAGVSYWFKSAKQKVTLDKVHTYDKVLDIINTYDADNSDGNGQEGFTDSSQFNKFHTPPTYNGRGREHQIRTITETNGKLKENTVSNGLTKAQTKTDKPIYIYETNISDTN